MAGIVTGIYDETCSQDLDGHRTFERDYLVETSDFDGPEAALWATGLPSPGVAYAGDPWAFATPERKVKKHGDYNEGDPVNHWITSCTFTTKPMRRCNSTSIENPLNEPPRLSGGFNKLTKERLVDMDGKPLLYSTFERIRGPLVERRTGLPTLTCEINVATLPLGGYLSMVERLNDAVFWGFPKRWVRLVDIVWSRKLYGVCFYYYTVAYTFEFKEGGYDEPILNEGKKMLKPGGTVTNPKDYIYIKDSKDDFAGPVPIKLDGSVVTNLETELVFLNKKIDKEANFLLLGVPPSL